jgi:hypothetical protein
MKDAAALSSKQESLPGGRKTGEYRHSFYYGRSSTCKPTGLAPAPLIASITFTTLP